MPDVYRDWDTVYKHRATPWDVEEAEDALVALIKKGVIKPCRALEFGCGHGNDSIFLAKSGFSVTAIDISKRAIGEAKRRAERTGVNVNFIASDVTDLKGLQETFDFLYDRACFHFIPEEKRESYLKNARRLLRSGGYYVLMVSSDVETPKGPYQFSKEEIRRIFGKDFDILDLRLITLEKHLAKPTPYFCLMRRK